MSVVLKVVAAVCTLATALVIPINGAAAKSRVSVLYNFTGASDGGQPYGQLMRDKAGNLYGTTYAGGANNSGTVFKVAPNGKETVLYSFKGNGDGSFPYAGLIADKDGNFYGTTTSGGANGQGTVFALTSVGKETPLYSFTGSSDGGQPFASLARDDAGNLYGTARSGGASFGGGVVFKVSPAGKETVLHTFEEDGADGYHPNGVYMDSKGNLFGTTYEGGASFSGIAYEITSAGKEKLLYTFTRANDGGAPEANLIRDATGNFYSTTYYGGADGNGVVFKLTSKGKETPLYAFTGGDGLGDGAYSYGTLAVDSAGNLYGTTVQGGKNSNGIVFKVTAKGKETVLYSFGAPSEGFVLPKDLIIDDKGNLYGVTSGGGKHNAGMVYEVTP